MEQRVLRDHKIQPPTIALGIREDFLEEAMPQ